MYYRCGRHTGIYDSAPPTKTWVSLSTIRLVNDAGLVHNVHIPCNL